MSNNKESASVAALTATQGEPKSNALTQDIQQQNYSPEMLESELPGMRLLSRGANR
jgi:hypothetical protein